MKLLRMVYRITICAAGFLIIACSVDNTNIKNPDTMADSRPPLAISESAQIVSGMSLSQKIGQLLILQFRYDESGRGITALRPSDIELMKLIQPGGVILFTENIRETAQVIELVSSLVANSNSGLFVSLDEEGGLVSRLVRSGLIPATPIPSARKMASGGSVDSIKSIYSIVGSELSSLGFNMNFAPVADLFTNPDNQVISSRSFGTDPYTSADMVVAAVEGLQSESVLSIVKHFPGHGDSSGDSHFSRIELPQTIEELQNRELIPFKAAMTAGAAGVMTAHLFYPNVDDGVLPASLNPLFIRQLIRDNYGYQGLVITDALEMKGVENLGGIRNSEEAGIAALVAGADMLLIPPDPRRQWNMVIAAVLEGKISMKRINESVNRIVSAKLDLGIWYNQEPPNLHKAETVLGSVEHRKILEDAINTGF